MRLYLIQHGEPVPGAVDPAKPLSPKGIVDVGKTAALMMRVGVGIKTVFHSHKTRSVQTARILAAAMGPGCALIQREDLSPNDPIDTIFKEISVRDDDTAIVGHQPFLSKLASKLLLGREDKDLVEFKQGGVICLARQGGTWKVQWAITPDLVRKE